MRGNQHQLATALVSWCLIHGALSDLTNFPSNQIIVKGDDVYMDCSTDASTGFNTITWRYDAATVITIPCTSSYPERFNVSSTNTNDCNIVGLSNTVSGNQGPYHCSDGSGKTAEAVALLIDPEPSCGVITSPPIRDQSVTLRCTLSYIQVGDELRVNPGADMSPAISWETAAGTFVTNSSTLLPNNNGRTLQVDVTQTPTGTEIPSYTCTSSFIFSDTPSLDFIYALNDLSWPCVSAPVLTWYCPDSATLSPSTGPFETGDVLKCEAEGYPLEYSWTDANGDEVSTTSTFTIREPGAFELTCKAYGNFTTPCSATSNTVSGTATGDRITTVESVTVTGDGNGNGNGTGQNGNGTTDDGGGNGDGGGGLSTGVIAAIAAALALLLLAALIIGILIWRRRKRDDGRPYSIAFYQAVRAGRPAQLACRGKEKVPPWMTGAYRPRSIDHQVYDQYCGPGNCFAPHYNQQSIPMSPYY